MNVKKNTGVSMGVRKHFFRGGKSTFFLFFSGRHFAYSVSFLMLQCKGTFTKRFTLSTPQREFPCYDSSRKNAVHWQQCFYSLILLFTPYKNTGLTTIGSHCLFGLPATDECFQQSYAEKRLLPPVTSSKPLEICCHFATHVVVSQRLPPGFK